jgi:hypothetical protein
MTRPPRQILPGPSLLAPPFAGAHFGPPTAEVSQESD